MNRTIACPTCGKRFAARPELLGSRVRCPGCREPFTAELEPDLPPTAIPFDAEPATAAAAVVRPPRSGPSAAGPKPTPVPSAEDQAAQAHAQATAFRIGVRLLALGAGAMLLPAVGLTPARRSLLSKIGVVTAAALMTGGAVLCVLGKSTFGGPVLMRLSRWGQRLILIALIGFLALLVLAAALVLLVTSTSKSNRADPTVGPARTATRPPHPNAHCFRPPAPKVAGNYDELLQAYGPARVVRIRITVGKPEDWNETGILEQVRGVMKNRAGANQVVSEVSDTTGQLAGAPVGDLGVLVRALPVDPATVAVDRNERIVTISLGGKPKDE